jgi:hypothetical protein
MMMNIVTNMVVIPTDGNSMIVMFPMTTVMTVAAEAP